MRQVLQGFVLGFVIFLIGEAWYNKIIRDDHTEQIETLVETCETQNKALTVQDRTIGKIIDIITK